MRKITVPSLVLLLCVVATMASAAPPAISVCVSDSSGKVVFRDVTHPDTPFVTGNLAAGNYVVQLNSTNAALNSQRYLLVVSAGKRKVIAESVAAEQFGRGGVAMRVQVGPGLKIIGEVARATASVSDVSFEKMREWQDRGGEGSLRDRFAGQSYKWVEQTGRGY